MKIAVVGFGYVGLRLAIQFARSNVNVIGLDVVCREEVRRMGARHRRTF